MTSRSNNNRALSLLEVALAVSIIGFVVSVASPTYQRVFQSSQVAKLEHDIVSINASVGTYLASGGGLDGLSDPQAILDKMKTVLDGEGYGFFKGSMVDRRLKAVMLPLAEVASHKERAVWDTGRKQFRVAKSGSGVREFILDEQLASVDYGSEQRDAWGYDVLFGEATPSEGLTLIAPTLVAMGTTSISGGSPTALTPGGGEPLDPGWFSGPTDGGDPYVPPAEPEPEVAITLAPLDHTHPVDISMLLSELAAAGFTGSDLGGNQVYLVTISDLSDKVTKKDIRYIVTYTINGQEVTTVVQTYTEPFTVTGDEVTILAELVPVTASDGVPIDKVEFSFVPESLAPDADRNVIQSSSKYLNADAEQVGELAVTDSATTDVVDTTTTTEPIYTTDPVRMTEPVRTTDVYTTDVATF